MSFIGSLVALQEHDRVIRDLELQIRDIPIRRKQEEDRISSELKTLIEARNAVSVSKLAIRETEEYIRELNENVKKLKQQQLTLKTNQEFSSMNTQITREQEKITSEEGELLSLYSDLTSIEAYEKECAARHDETKSSIDTYLFALDGRLAESKQALEKAKAERAKFLAPLVSPSNNKHLMYYERLLKSRWPVVVEISKGVCSGCHMSLPPSKVQDVRRGEGVVICDFCGRIVYIN